MDWLETSHQTKKKKKKKKLYHTLFLCSYYVINSVTPNGPNPQNDKSDQQIITHNLKKVLYNEFHWLFIFMLTTK